MTSRYTVYDALHLKQKRSCDAISLLPLFYADDNPELRARRKDLGFAAVLSQQRFALVVLRLLVLVDQEKALLGTLNDPLPVISFRILSQTSHFALR